MPRERLIPLDNRRNPDDVRLVVDLQWDVGGAVVGLRTTSATPDDTVAPGGTYATLDRYTVNRLIRTLRRARDDCYGADE